MKIIILNRRLISYVSIILGVILIILSAQLTFNSKLKSTAFMQNGISQLTEYYTVGKKYQYKLPNNWNTNEESFDSSEIVYHNNFVSDDLKLHGFAEVWKLKTPLKKFLENSKSSSYKPGSVLNYKIKKTKIKNFETYLVTYNMKNQSGEIYKAWEYYIEENNEFFRICFFVPQEEYKANLPVVFESITNTFNKV
ncbi:hypothetical protein [Clostridium oryzae]|uniref:PsbP C-terminal domain-containing protein n=1 Tax=Clostridium oryzae TaxID=1450648 RepID=A0A1V4IN64_9CLOT|nr:hypothetical protein [Clostridium oryzae]OPJ61289.1 hypothetical protein CLORY_23290 [Clostridium oryzae]